MTKGDETGMACSRYGVARSAESTPSMLLPYDEWMLLLFDTSIRNVQNVSYMLHYTVIQSTHCPWQLANATASIPHERRPSICRTKGKFSI
jgi:hypothetical protein